MSNKSELFSSLPDIDFTAKDPDTITQEVISRYELFTGRSLARGDPIRLFLNAIILELVQQRNEMDFTGKMNLLSYSQGDYLDHIGANIGVTRLGASSAVTTIRFSLSGALGYDAVIPQGTRISPDGKIYFATTEDTVIPAGQIEADVIARCVQAGVIGNDYVAGQISRAVDVLPYEASARNIDTSTGGEDAETNDAFRERIQIAPETFTTAGSIKGYEYFALSADPNIAAVSVVTHRTDENVPVGSVNLCVLMKGGAIPDDDILAKVLAACGSDDVRPDTDYVHALKPQKVSYNIDAKYWIERENASQSMAIQAKVNDAVMEYVRWQRSGLGRDINPSQLGHDIIAAGAKRCVVNAPIFRTVGKNQVAVNEGTFNLVYSGLED